MQAALGEYDTLDAVVHQHGSDFPGFRQHALADTKLTVDYRRIIENIMLFSGRRAVVVDEADRASDQGFRQFLRILNRGAAQDELRMAAVEFAQANQPPQHVGQVAAEYATVCVDLVNDDIL